MLAESTAVVPLLVAKSPIVTPIASPPGLARSRATIARDKSMPWTGMLRARQRQCECDASRADVLLQGPAAVAGPRRDVGHRVHDALLEHVRR